MEACTTVVVPRTVVPARRGRSSDSTRCHSRDNACASRVPQLPTLRRFTPVHLPDASGGDKGGEKKKKKYVRNSASAPFTIIEKTRPFFSYTRLVTKPFERYGNSVRNTFFFHTLLVAKLLCASRRVIPLPRARARARARIYVYRREKSHVRVRGLTARR